MWFINHSPAVKIVDLRHVSKEDVSLAVQDWGQKPRQSWVVHLSLVALQHLIRAAQLRICSWFMTYKNQTNKCTVQGKVYKHSEKTNEVFSHQQHWQQLLNIDSFSLYEFPHHMAAIQANRSTQRESQRASLALNKENHKANNIKNRIKDTDRWVDGGRVLTASRDLGCPLPLDRTTHSSGSPGNHESPLSEHNTDNITKGRTRYQ